MKPGLRMPLILGFVCLLLGTVRGDDGSTSTTEKAAQLTPSKNFAEVLGVSEANLTNSTFLNDWCKNNTAKDNGQSCDQNRKCYNALYTLVEELRPGMPGQAVANVLEDARDLKITISDICDKYAKNNEAGTSTASTTTGSTSTASTTTGSTSTASTTTGEASTNGTSTASTTNSPTTNGTTTASTANGTSTASTTNGTSTASTTNGTSTTTGAPTSIEQGPKEDSSTNALYWSIPLAIVLLAVLALAGFVIYRYTKRAGFLQAAAAKTSGGDRMKHDGSDV